MAEILTEFAFRRQGGRKWAEHPWDEWFDGQIRKAVKGVDYNSKTRSFASLVGTEARRRGITARTNIVDDGNAVVFQSYDKPESEPTDER